MKKEHEKIKLKSRWGDEYEHINPSNNGWKIILALSIAAIAITLICKFA
jgi:hypothetical protein